MEEVIQPKKPDEIADILENFHFPRWEELPDFDLYMDQVVTLVNQILAPLLPKNASLTPSMVNNYVKQKLLPAPSKKKYNKEHLAFLLVISLLKQVMMLPDIQQALDYQLKLEGRRSAYESFCFLQEQSLKEVGDQVRHPHETTLTFHGDNEKTLFLRSITLSLALKIYSEIILNISSRRMNHE